MTTESIILAIVIAVAVAVWRNRASNMSKDLGEYVNARPTVYFVEPAELANRSRDGYYLLRHDNLYQWRQHKRHGPIVLSRNLGFKLEHVMDSGARHGFGRSYWHQLQTSENLTHFFRDHYAACFV